MRFLGFKRKPSAIHAPNVRNFFVALANVASPAGRGDYAFAKSDGSRLGYAQFIIESYTRVTIHRLWTRNSGAGAGSAILRTLCGLADTHAVELTLKTIPFGRKPYPLNTDQLAGWYSRYGFQKTGKYMTRKPRTAIDPQASGQNPD